MSSERNQRDYLGGVPRSRQVAAHLKAAIESGEYPVGSVLPPLRQIAADYEVSVNTASMAMQLLHTEGYASGRPNAGNYVRDRSSQVDPAEQVRKLRAEVKDLEADVRQTVSHLSRISQRLKNIDEMVDGLDVSHRSE